MIDRAQRRARDVGRARNHLAARDAQAELHRMGRSPGPLLGAVERLQRARIQEDADVDGQERWL